jgi:hypothetical protein
MSVGFDSFQNLGKGNFDVALKSADAVSKGFQAIATEAADYSRRSLDAGSTALEKLTSAKSMETITAVQSEYVRSAYEGYVGQVAKVGEIFAEMAKSAAKPYEAFFGKFGK